MTQPGSGSDVLFSLIWTQLVFILYGLNRNTLWREYMLYQHRVATYF